MTREFPDELLSALIDDELSPAERAEVERHLAASEADRQLVAELKALRAEVASLPRVTVSPHFADRVVRAAMAEAEQRNDRDGIVSKAPPAARRLSKGWMALAAATCAAALAASFLLVVQPWKSASDPKSALPIAAIPGAGQAVALKDQLVSALQAAAPAEGEAVVLRLHAGKDVRLDDALVAALAKAGILARASDAVSASSIVSAYGRMLNTKLGAKAADATVAAAQAMFVDATLDRLEAAFGGLDEEFKQPLQVRAATKLAFALARSEDTAEGEPGSANKAPAAAGQPFAQRLEAALFRLEKEAAEAAIRPGPATSPFNPQQRVRLLILVEPE
jgi:Putative zinc-finger